MEFLIMAANECWFLVVQWTVAFLRVLSETHGMLPQLNEEKVARKRTVFFLAKKSVGKSKKLEAILLLKSSSFSAMKTVFWRSILQRSITMQSFVLPFAFPKGTLRWLLWNAISYTRKLSLYFNIYCKQNIFIAFHGMFIKRKPQFDMIKARVI